MASVRTRRSPRKHPISALSSLNERPRDAIPSTRALQESDAESDDELLDLEAYIELSKARNDSLSVSEKDKTSRPNPLLSTSFIPSLKPTASIPVALKVPGKTKTLGQDTTSVIGRSSRQAQQSRSPLKRGTAVLMRKAEANPCDDMAALDGCMGRLELGSAKDNSLKQDRRNRGPNARQEMVAPPRGQLRNDPFASKFVLKEANCNDDDSADEEGEDEDTDLSGFIVDDDHESDYDGGATSDQASSPEINPKKRTLVRGSRERHEQRETTEDSLADALENISLTHGHPKDTDRDLSTILKTIEVIDLTESPIKAPRPTETRTMKKATETALSKRMTSLDSEEEISDERNAIIRFAPPSRKSPLRITGKKPLSIFSAAGPNKTKPDRPSTPPLTPPGSPTKPKSPTKLKSPRKNPLLLSPSKDRSSRPIPKSPHRPSLDAFWSSEVVNDWNDQYSPQKPTLTISPRKRWKIWEDADNDDNSSSSSGSESPSESPARRASPSKPQPIITAPSSPTKKSLAADRKAVKATKAAFEATKSTLATDFLAQLDQAITDGQLATLSASTGGVQIIWSKTLRSTAGRANWRRTVVKTRPSSHAPPITEVKHFASIELATKVIDNPQRLANTLAHEFCHLTNFMISNVRDEPHGKSWRSWAAKTEEVFGPGKKGVDGRFCGVEVRTKHAYQIEYKYLWVCAGEAPDKQGEKAKRDEEGCGTEYGRHSKSIDPAMDQCGKCRGLLTQVRPKPRRQAVGVRKGGFGAGGRAAGVEELEKKLEAIGID